MTNEGWSQDLKPELPESRYGALSLRSMLLIHCISVTLVWLVIMFARRKQHQGRSVSLKEKKKCWEEGLLAMSTHFPALPGVALIILGSG